MKSCDTDVGGCGQLNSIQHLLEGAPPNVFTVQLAWESQHESSDAIRATLAAIQEVNFSLPLKCPFILPGLQGVPKERVFIISMKAAPPDL